MQSDKNDAGGRRGERLPQKARRILVVKSRKSRLRRLRRKREPNDVIPVAAGRIKRFRQFGLYNVSFAHRDENGIVGSALEIRGALDIRPIEIDDDGVIIELGLDSRPAVLGHDRFRIGLLAGGHDFLSVGEVRWAEEIGLRIS